MAANRKNVAFPQGSAAFHTEPLAVSERWSLHSVTVPRVVALTEGGPHPQNRKTRQKAPRGPTLQVKPFLIFIFVRNQRHRANMYIPLYLIQHRHVTHKQKSTLMKKPVAVRDREQLRRIE